jgi:hypothetical protein
MSAAQLELFVAADRGAGAFGHDADDEPSSDFIATIRAELESTLSRVRQAPALPWPDLTRATLAELRFKSISAWLPDDEASALKSAFAAEMRRLYEAAGEPV